MMEELAFGAAACIAWRCASKSGGAASPASCGTGGSDAARYSRCRCSNSEARIVAGPGIQRLS